MIEYIRLAFSSGAVTFAYWVGMYLLANAVCYKVVLWTLESSDSDSEHYKLYITSITFLVFIDILINGVVLSAFSNFILTL